MRQPRARPRGHKTISGLAASTTYAFAVSAFNSAGEGPQSGQVQATTSASGGGGGGGGGGSFAVAPYVDLTNSQEGVHPCVRPAANVVPGAKVVGKAGVLMTGAAVRETVTLAGLAERARVARAFVAAVLGPGHPCMDDAVLLVSEMFGNSVRHSRSGDPGKTITVAVKTGNGVVRVEVTDRSGPGVPELNSAGRDEEGGRGLQLVAGLAARWGWRRRRGRTVTWFELSHG